MNGTDLFEANPLARSGAEKKKKASQHKKDKAGKNSKARKNTEARKRAKTRAASWWSMPLATFCMALVAIAVLLAVRENQNYSAFRQMKAQVMSDVFYDGVIIDDYDVSGHPLNEVMSFWERSIEKPYRERSVVFEVEGQSFCVSAEELGYKSDYESAIMNAYNSGRSGSLEARARQIGVKRERNESFTVTRQLYDPQKLREVTDSIAAKCTRERVNAAITDFSFDQKAFVFQSEVAGTYVDADKLYKQAEYALTEGLEGALKVDVEIIEPEVTLDELKNQVGMITQAVTNASSSSKARLNNLNLACMAIYGSVVQPGETFSFNDTVGKRTKDKGYKLATVYQSGELSEDIGGGVCQVSTTLWNAAMKADCEIVERHEHSRPVSYVDKGKDATVSWGSQDMKFKNTSDNPLYIVAYLNENKRVVVEIYGKLFPDGNYIEITQKVTRKIDAPEPVRTYNPSLARGEEVVVSEARKGYHAIAYRVYKDKDGNELKKVELCRSYYKEAAAKIEYGL